jgi:hypothetical protein
MQVTVISEHSRLVTAIYMHPLFHTAAHLKGSFILLREDQLAINY